ncbi:MAG: hypothetical protein H0T76_16345 [Nannocystis sp.]|nr:Hint domain-containing protein [Nannocystis sp.]MBA3548052.1 hypothetical protein [Nannocystis sp.]
MVGPRTGLLSLALLGPACCVSAATLVRTPRGEVAAGSLEIGDLVWSVDVASGGLVEGRIVAMRRATRECVALHWGDGTLVCTSDHPLFDPERGVYRPAGDWVTNAGRPLLRSAEAGVSPVLVARAESFVGLHEVVDLTLASEPHNFVAAGIVVHNKSFASTGPIEEVEGPDFELTTTERTREFRVKACQGGQDIGYGLLKLNVEARPIPVPEGGKSLWLSAFIEGEALEVIDGPAPISLAFDNMRVPSASCTSGFVVGFMRLDERDDGVIAVGWHIEVEGDYADQEEDDAVSVVVEPEA